MPREAAQHLCQQHKAQGRGSQSPKTHLQRGKVRGCLTWTARSSTGWPHKLSSSQPNLRGVLTLRGGKPTLVVCKKHSQFILHTIYPFWAAISGLMVPAYTCQPFSCSLIPCFPLKPASQGEQGPALSCVYWLSTSSDGSSTWADVRLYLGHETPVVPL